MINAVYTIGHSTHTIDAFIGLLTRNAIAVVCDVRSKPYSRMNPQFNQEELKASLLGAGIKYVFLGKELGARTNDKSCYKNGQVQYDLLAETSLFKSGIERVKDGAQSYRIALMCAEKEPLDCHRTILVSRKLFDEGMEVKHILGNGQAEAHEDTIQRLLAKLRMPEGDMFLSKDDIVRQAYFRQGNDIAYQEQSPGDSTAERGVRQPASRVAE